MESQVSLLGIALNTRCYFSLACLQGFCQAAQIVGYPFAAYRGW